MDQKQAEPEKIVKFMNERISVKDSITLGEMFVKFRNRTIKSLVGLLVLSTGVALFSAVAGYYLPLLAGMIIGVALSVGACYWSSRKILVEVHKITKR